MVPKNRGIVKEQMIIGSALLFIVLIFMQHVAASVKREVGKIIEKLHIYNKPRLIGPG